MAGIPGSFDNIKAYSRTTAVVAVPVTSLKSAIGEGQLVSARVVKLLGDNKGIVEINGQRLVAELKTSLIEGQEMILEAKGMQDGRLVLQIMSVGEQSEARVAQQDVFAKILAKAGLPITESNLQIVSSLMDEQAQITVPLLKDISRGLLAAGKQDGLSIRSAVFLAVRDMPLTAENIRLTSLALQEGGLGEAIARTLAGQSGDQLPEAVVKTPSEAGATSSSGTAGSSGTASSTGIAGQTTVKEQVTLNALQPGTAQAAGVTKPTDGGIATPAQVTAAMEPDSQPAGQTIGQTNAQANTLTNTLTNTQTNIPANGEALVPGTQPTGETEQPTVATGQQPSVSADQNTDRITDQIIRTLPEAQPSISPATSESTPSQTGIAQPEPVEPQSARSLQNFLADTLGKLLLVKVGQKGIGETGGAKAAIESQLMTSGQSFQAGEQLAQIIDKLVTGRTFDSNQPPGSQTVPESQLQTGEAAHSGQINPAPLDLTNLRDVFTAHQVIQNSLRQSEPTFIAYLPVPIQWEGDQAGGDLYIWKRPGKDAEDPEGLHVLFLLQTPNSGGWRIDLVNRGENLSINIGVEDEEVQRMVNSNLEPLRTKVEAQGFKINHLNCTLKNTSQQIGDVEASTGFVGTEGLDITI